MSFKDRIKCACPRFHFNIETWKYYKPLDVYVSSMGRIKNTKGELQSCGVKGNYLMYRGCLVHRIVMETFKAVPNYAHMTVDHLNHNTRDNSVNNLEWVTLSENQQRAQNDQDKNCIDLPNEENIQSQDFILNGVRLSEKTARSIMLNDKSFGKNINGINNAFEKAKVNNTDTDVTFGHYTLRKCKD